MLEDSSRFEKWMNAHFAVNENGKIMRTKGKGYIDKPSVYLKYLEHLHECGDELDGTKKDVLDALDAWIKANSSNDGAGQLSVEDAVRAELNMALGKVFKINSTFNQVHYKNRDSKYYSNGSFDTVLDYLRMRRPDSELLSGYDWGPIEAAAKMIQMSSRNRAQNQLIERLKYDPVCEATRDEVLKSIYRFLEIKQPYEQFRMVFLHWMWQVKRKITNQKVVWHIWLNLFGPTKIGKSWIVRHLCSPMEDFYLESTIGTMLDQTKEVMKYTEYFLINFEELAVNSEASKFAGGEATLTADQIAVLKSMLTGEKLDTRIYGKQMQMKRDITFSCISTANYHLYDVLYDETSMRRYYELDCQRSVPGTSEEREKLNAMLDKSIELWKGVDEGLERGYWDEAGPIGKAVDAEQRAYMPTKSTLVAWNEYYDFQYNSNVETESIYAEYKGWCKSMGFIAKTLVNFNGEIHKRFPNLVGSDGHPHFSAVPKGREMAELDHD